MPGIEPSSLEEISTALSRAKIEDAIAAPTITDLEREAGTEPILSLLLYELEKINKMFNSNERLKLSHEQCADIAILIFEEFPHESLEDFVLAFRKGITGRYDEKLLRLDVQVIFRWIRLFLDEKAQKVEHAYKLEKQEEIKPYTEEEKANIAKIVNESWVGETLRREKQNSEEYRRFKAEFLTKKSAENEKLQTPDINSKDNAKN